MPFLWWFFRLSLIYWRRPVHWPQIWRMASRYVLEGKFVPGVRAKQHRRTAGENAAALEWCAGCAISSEELTGHLSFPFVLTGVIREFPDEFRQAEERVAASQVKFGGAGNLDLLYSLSRAVGARSIVETGVAAGWSSLALLLAVNGDENARLYSTDIPYPLTHPPPPEKTSGGGRMRILGSGAPCRHRCGGSGGCSEWQIWRDCHGPCAKRVR